VTRRPRPGYTLMEMVAVLAVVLILGAVTVPTLNGLKGNADQRAAADAVRERIADARGLAMEQGQPYRLAVSADGTRLRVAPDGEEFASAQAAQESSSAATAIETKLDKAKATVAADEEYGPPPADGGGWVTIGTFLPDGTCREVGATIEVHEGRFPVLRIHLRGVSASARVLHPDAKHGGG
jgi:prepilin-type N-terminal cleavage/methylation domain-containing protein